MKMMGITVVVWVLFASLAPSVTATPPPTWQQLLEDAKKAYQKGDKVQTEKLLQQALSEAERLGPDHPSLAVCLYNLARVQADMGRFEAAEPLLLRTVTILAGVWGADNPRVSVAQLSLADVRVAQNHFADAEPLYLDHYAALLRKAGRPAEAEPLEARVRDIRGKQSPPPRTP
jgi:hypothetical protein